MVSLFVNRGLIIYVYLFLLPTNFFLPLVTNIFGFISGQEIVSGFALIAAFQELQHSRTDPDFAEEDYITGPRKYALTIAALLLGYLVLTRFRDVITHFNPDDSEFGTFNLISFSVKIFIFFAPLYYIIRLS